MKQGFVKYLVWIVATLFAIYSFCLNTAAAVFLDAIKSTLHTNNYGVSIASGSFIFGFACMQIPVGYFMDKYPAKSVVSTGILLMALGNIAISYADNLVLFTLANLVQGIGASFAFVAATVLISEWFSKEAFPIFFGLMQAASCIMAGIIHYVFTLALNHYHWTFIYQILAVCGLVLFILSLFFVKNPLGFKQAAPLSLKNSLFQVLKNPQILLCSIAAATSFGVLLAYASLWYKHVESFYFVENLDAVVISGIIFLGLGLGTPLWGYLSNLVKSRVIILHSTVVLGTMALLLSLYLPHFNQETLVITKIVAFITGFFISGSMLLYTIVSEISTKSTRGVAISLLNTFVFLFNTLMLFIPYLFVTALSQQFFTYLWIIPFSCLISILCIYFIK